jgi:hypothetical protein
MDPIRFKGFVDRPRAKNLFVSVHLFIPGRNGSCRILVVGIVVVEHVLGVWIVIVDIVLCVIVLIDDVVPSTGRRRGRRSCCGRLLVEGDEVINC